MASTPFQASIISGVTNSTDAQINGSVLTLGDDSNYYATTENACGATLFNAYRTYSVTYYQGPNYALSSIASPPTCAAWYGGANPTINLTTGDGWYSVIMQTVPTWNQGGSTYTANVHQVWNPTDKNLYTCITNNVSNATNRPDLSPAIWKVIPANNPLIPVSSVIFSKYTAQAYFAIMQNSAICLPQLINNALCGNGLNCDNASLCKNDNFINALKALLCIYSIQTANASNQLQFTTNTFDLLNSICSCD